MHMVSITSFALLCDLITKMFELGATIEIFILPVSIWSCTMRGFWNWRRFLRMLLWHVCLTVLPAHVALFLNAMVLVATVVFDYENEGTYYHSECLHYNEFIVLNHAYDIDQASSR